MVNLKAYGVVDGAAQFLQKNQLKDRALWKKFVDVFVTRPDADNQGWRGEFWGKMMRGGVLVYQYTNDAELYEVLSETVADMLCTADGDGRVSSYVREKEFDAWDIWCRKYVILACEYYLDICKDEQFKNRIITFICRAADHILEHIGNGEGQKQITDASRSWLGLNSSSVLEPIVRLYRITNDKKYLDFATYIIKQGGARGVNVFELAYRNEVYPYQYGVSKAYEMMSCFEGLLEYYYATGNEDCKTAVINFANAIIKTELSVIGCSGITHELFDFTAARQTVRQEDVLQETCVTVTWMKLCSRLLELTGDTRFADCMEQSFYNAYLGAFNTERKISPYIRKKFIDLLGYDDVVDTFLAVDSYSPLLSGKRGAKVGGNQLLSDLSYYGCCTCIAPAGVGVVANNMVSVKDGVVTVNFFESMTAKLTVCGKEVTLTQKTDYPTDGKIKITVNCKEPVEFELRIRVPRWSGSDVGYKVYKKLWSEDTVLIEFAMDIRTQRPMVWDKEVIYTDMSKMVEGNHTAAPITVYHNPDDDNYIALMRGPVTLAADSRTGKDAGDVFDFEPCGQLTDQKEIVAGVPCLLKMKFKDKSTGEFYLVDYCSAGRDWQTDIAAWLKTK